MKPRKAALTGIAITAAIFLQKEAEAVECKEKPCVAETFARTPAQPHSHDELPIIVEAQEYVMNMGSPVLAIKVGGDEYNNLLDSYPDFLKNNPPFKLDSEGQAIFQSYDSQ